MPATIIILLIPLLPLAAFVLLGLFGKKYVGKSSGIIATLAILVSTVLALQTATQYFTGAGLLNGTFQSLQPWSYDWLVFSTGQSGLSIKTGILLDPISVMMLVVVTFISLMVHVYSLGYMKGEERFSMYYAYLGLFTFSMLGLVMSSNIFQMYMCWELVGLSSFLLIGFYYEKPSAVAACKKAFIVTRFADLGFLLGILILSNQSGTLDFNSMIDTLGKPGVCKNLPHFMGLSALSWGLALVFIGGAGKSALFPLHIWLPDAMEGPTPVSALIHAATMVVAGVFLVARLFPIFSVASSNLLNMVAVVGVISAFIAAVIACTQTDIKRVLAYSTMSQIGFMIFALGVSGYGGENGLGYTASLFHLFTHAMFKALLFLGAGAVIHYVHSNEMKDMGGLRKQMPITHLTFLLACLAIAGVPPFAGFFSKEAILLAAYESNRFVYWIALGTSALTAFYMFRLYFRIFWHTEPHVHENHHGEGTNTMKLPLLILGLCSVAAGFIPFSHYVSSDGKPFETHFHLAFSVAPVTLGLLGIITAYVLYARSNGKPDAIAGSLGAVYRAAYRKFYIDEVYLFITKKLLFGWIGSAAAWFDKYIVDGLVNATGWAAETVSNKLKIIQSGRIQQYAVYFLAGVLLMAVLFIYMWH